MPPSVQSAPLATSRRRLSQSMNRVATLGALSGMDPASLPVFRTDSPMTLMSDELRHVYGAPSCDSIVAVLASVGDPRTSEPSAPPESGREVRRNSIAMRDGGQSMASERTDSGKGRSRSRARKEELVAQRVSAAAVTAIPQIQNEFLRQQIEKRQAERARYVPGPRSINEARVVSRPPLSHPTILRPGPDAGHRKAVSEYGLDTGSTALKRGSARASKRKSSIVTSASQALPDWAAAALKGTQFEAAAGVVIPPMPPIPSDEDEARIDSRRASTATVTRDSYVQGAKEKTVRVSRAGGKKSQTARSVSGLSEDDDTRSAYSTYSAATISHLPRGSSIERRALPRPSGVESARIREVAARQEHAAREKKKRTVTVRNVEFEMVSPSSVRSQPLPRTTPLFVPSIPPSREPASSYSVIEAARMATPPSPSSSVSSASAATSPTRSSRSSHSARSSAATSLSGSSRSRSSSPARGAYNPQQHPGTADPTVRDRVVEHVARFRQDLKQRVKDLSPTAAKAPQPQAFELRGPVRKAGQEDIASWQCPAGVRKGVLAVGASSSFAQRAEASSRRRDDRDVGPKRISAYIPPAAPAPVPAIASVGSRPAIVSLREQESSELFMRRTTQKRESFLGAPAPDVGLPSKGSVAQFDFNFSGAGRGPVQTPSLPAQRAETPPDFEPVPQRKDSLFMGSGGASAHTAQRDSFFASWAEPKTPAATASELSIQSHEELDVVAAGFGDPRRTEATAPVDDRRVLPSQQQASRSNASPLQRQAVANAAGAASHPPMARQAGRVGSVGSGGNRALRRKGNVGDFSKVRHTR
ncbi:hypothetical protein JX265_006315 [Neoarthrinium moseri]|uniref:Uncharacterized protein n=1 Tax=Neoarthrinium moseri TaxID=1658444 RepID=A0A9P9WM94_9PEZI|nr:hypothetical protein JX265_006315 [Neoarthrinium moseri]